MKCRKNEMMAAPTIARASAVAILVMLAAAVLTAQKAKPPLTPWGKPDLQGMWDFRSLTPMERPSEVGDKAELTAEEATQFAKEAIRRQSRDEANLEAEVGKGRVVPYNDFWFDWGTKLAGTRTSLIVDPPDGRIPPLTAEAARRQAAQREARRGVEPDQISPGGWLDELSPPVRCLLGFNQGPPMTPSAYNNNMQIFQTPDHVAILNEMIHDARIVPLDGRPHLAERIPQWLGSSRGRWEGNTLVVETINRRDDSSFRGAGRNLKLTERFTRADADTLVYEATLNDSTTWTRPWTFMVPMAKTSDKIYEYACHEANYYMANMLNAVRMAAEAPATSR